MFSPVPFQELEVRNTSKTGEPWTKVITISGLTHLLVSEDDFLSGAETTPAHCLNNLVLGVSGSTEQEKTLSCDSAWTSTPSWNVCAPKKAGNKWS